MDQAILGCYKKLLRNGFPHVGKMALPDVFIDSLGEKMQLCGSITRAYIHIFISVETHVITKISYLCVCDPIANVVLEILCDLVEGKPVTTCLTLTEKDFSHHLNCTDETFLDRSRHAIALLGTGLKKYV